MAENQAEVAQLPTLPGKAAGIVGMDPLVLQCRDCGTTYTGTRRSVAVLAQVTTTHGEQDVPNEQGESER